MGMLQMSDIDKNYRKVLSNVKKIEEAVSSTKDISVVLPVKKSSGLLGFSTISPHKKKLMNYLKLKGISAKSIHARNDAYSVLMPKNPN